MRVAAIVPVKTSSRRLPNKNFLNLGGVPLAAHIFETLLGVESCETIFCYTSRSDLLALLPSGVELLPRPPSLDGDDVLANELFGYAVERLHDYDVLVICHPTSPYISARNIDVGIQAVTSGLHDSAFSVQKHLKYAWFEGSPFNYDPFSMAQTQNLEPVMLETSGFYCFRRDAYLKNNSRIGKNPLLVEVSHRESVDIDYPEDFSFARHLLKYSDDRETAEREVFVKYAASNARGAPLHVSFDMDGVVLNSLSAMQKAWARVCESLDIQIDFSQYRKHIGKPLTEILALIGVPEQKQEAAFSAYVAATEKYQDLTELYPEMDTLLCELAEENIKVSIVTSKPKQRALALADHYGLSGHLDALVCPEDVAVGRGKPSPDPILLACLNVGVDPAQTIYVGDMTSDKEAAGRAGCAFIHAAWGYESLPFREDVWFASSGEFRRYILEIVHASAAS